MKVKMLTPIAGQGRAADADGIWECDEEEGARLIAAGLAVPLREGAATAETATEPVAERAGGRRKAAR